MLKTVKLLSVNEKFEKLSWEMFERLMAKIPHFATFIGLHEPYDKLLPHGARRIFSKVWVYWRNGLAG